MTTNHEREQQFARQLGDMLSESVNRIDPEHARALAAGRQRALTAAGAGRGRQGAVMALAAAASVAALAVAGLWIAGSQQTSGLEVVADIETQDFEIMVGEESLEMMAELEFYDWLSDEADAG